MENTIKEQIELTDQNGTSYIGVYTHTKLIAMTRYAVIKMGYSEIFINTQKIVSIRPIKE